MRLQLLHMLGPRIDQRYVVTRRCHVGTRVAADRAGTDNRDTFGHSLVSPLTPTGLQWNRAG